MSLIRFNSNFPEAVLCVQADWFSAEISIYSFKSISDSISLGRFSKILFNSEYRKGYDIRYHRFNLPITLGGFPDGQGKITEGLGDHAN